MDAAEPGVTEIDGDETVAVAVVAGEPAGTGADPQPTLGVGMKRLNIAIGQAVRVLRIRLIAAETIAVPTGEAALGADPQKACAVLGQRYRHRVRQPLLAAVVLKDGFDQIGPAFGGISPREAQQRQQDNEDYAPRSQHSSSLAMVGVHPRP